MHPYATEFVDQWIAENVRSRPLPWDDLEAAHRHAKHCVAAAAEAKIVLVADEVQERILTALDDMGSAEYDRQAATVD